MENEVSQEMYKLRVTNEKVEGRVGKIFSKIEELSTKHMTTSSRISKVEQEIKALQERHLMSKKLPNQFILLTQEKVHPIENVQFLTVKVITLDWAHLINIWNVIENNYLKKKVVIRKVVG